MSEPEITQARAGPMLMQIADRVLGRPLLLHPNKAEVILHVLQGRLNIEGALAPLSPEANSFVGERRGSGRGGTFAFAGGVGIVTITGSLVNRGAWIGADSGLTSYEGIAKQLDDAAADKQVKSILIDCDSPGGEATGMFALAAKISAIAKEKPVIAVVNDMACSAMYGLISGCTEIVVSPTSIVGSIGVVLTHMDRSGELEKKGVAVTLIHAGRNKVDGHPFGPLSESVRADLQAEVGKFYDQFVGLVAQGRGAKLTEQDARATEARTYLGQEAIDRGLADRMGSFDAVLASLQSATPRAGNSKEGTRKMSGENMITQEAHTAAVSAARAEGETAGRKLGATEATARIGAILTSDEAKANPALASHFAFKSDMSADAAKEALKAAGPAAPAAGSGVRTIEERAAGSAEFGGDTPPLAAAEKTANGWKAAAAAANTSIGAV